MGDTRRVGVFLQGLKPHEAYDQSRRDVRPERRGSRFRRSLKNAQVGQVTCRPTLRRRPCHRCFVTLTRNQPINQPLTRNNKRDNVIERTILRYKTPIFIWLMNNHLFIFLKQFAASVLQRFRGHRHSGSQARQFLLRKFEKLLEARKSSFLRL